MQESQLELSTDKRSLVDVAGNEISRGDASKESALNQQV